MNTVLWIDFENAPHVWVFSQIIRDLRLKGVRIIMTARDFSYTLPLCGRFGFDVKVAGIKGTGRNNVHKAMRLMVRSLSLCRLMREQNNDKTLALSFGSRSQIMAARLLGFPVICLEDYEYSNQSLVRFVDHLLVPFPIPKSSWGRNASRVVHLPGLKEELYLCGFKPSLRLPELDDERVHILFRPEGRLTH